MTRLLLSFWGILFHGLSVVVLLVDLVSWPVCCCPSGGSRFMACLLLSFWLILFHDPSALRDKIVLSSWYFSQQHLEIQFYKAIDVSLV
jgi:hypothetical protein